MTPRVVEQQEVFQVIDGARSGRFLKERIVTRPNGLVLVRKRLRGEAPKGVVLLIHGWGQNRYSWHSTRRSLSSYLAARGFDVFKLDLSGVGGSRDATAPMCVRDHVHGDVPECIRAVLAVAGASDLFLVGHSMGGLISYGVVAGPMGRHVRGVIALAPPYDFAAGSVRLRAAVLAARLIGRKRLGRLNLPMHISIVGRAARSVHLLWDAPWFPAPLRGWPRGSIERDVLSEYLGRAFDRTTSGVTMGLFFMSEDTAPPPAEVPHLVIAGSKDQLAPVASVRPAYELSKSPDKTFRVFPVGHVDVLLGKEAPDTVWRTMGDWLEQRCETGHREPPGDELP